MTIFLSMPRASEAGTNRFRSGCFWARIPGPRLYDSSEEGDRECLRIRNSCSIVYLRRKRMKLGLKIGPPDALMDVPNSPRLYGDIFALRNFPSLGSGS